jgi:hypothetical protein
VLALLGIQPVSVYVGSDTADAGTARKAFLGLHGLSSQGGAWSRQFSGCRSIVRYFRRTRSVGNKVSGGTVFAGRVNLISAFVQPGKIAVATKAQEIY